MNNSFFSVSKNHIVTCILTENDQSIGYDHSDRKENDTGLDIVIAEQYKGKGYGTLLMDFLISKATENKVKRTHLTFDSNNVQDRDLYEKTGFSFVKRINERYILMEYKLEY